MFEVGDGGCFEGHTLSSGLGVRTQRSQRRQMTVATQHRGLVLRILY